MNMVFAELTITKDRRMHWDENKYKVGSRKDRHSLGRFVIAQACHLPVTVGVRLHRQKRSFNIDPVLINDSIKQVVLYHKRYSVCFTFDDVVMWIRIFINSNRMYEQDFFKVYI